MNLTPDQVADHPTSHTGRNLRKVLAEHPPQPVAA
jgi:excinuclease ABC subunit A